MDLYYVPLRFHPRLQVVGPSKLCLARSVPHFFDRYHKRTNVRSLEGLERSSTLPQLDLYPRLAELSRFIWSSFKSSSKKDHLVAVVRERLEECLWSSCFRELDAWSDEQKFRLLDLIVTIIHSAWHEVSVSFSSTRSS